MASQDGFAVLLPARTLGTSPGCFWPEGRTLNTLIAMFTRCSPTSGLSMAPRRNQWASCASACQRSSLKSTHATAEVGRAFQQATAIIGTAGDINAFLKLGASLDMRAKWYGWSVLSFAASHHNVETFQAIVRQSPPDVYESLDGDGWTLLHCCIYFGAHP